MNPIKDMEFPIEQALQMACCINRVNGFTSVSKYITTDTTGELRYTNKDHLTYQLIPSLAKPDYQFLFNVTKEDADQAIAIIKHFRRLSFGVLADTINDYKARIFKVTQLGYVTMSDFGVLASVPSVYEKEYAEKVARELIAETVQECFGKIGDSVDLEIVYIRSKKVEQLGCFSHEAITSTNHLVSFLSQHLLGAPGDQQRIKAKIKRHGQNYLSKTPETQLNYVKVVDEKLEWQ